MRGGTASGLANAGGGVRGRRQHQLRRAAHAPRFLADDHRRTRSPACSGGRPRPQGGGAGAAAALTAQGVNVFRGESAPRPPLLRSRSVRGVAPRLRLARLARVRCRVFAAAPARVAAATTAVARPRASPVSTSVRLRSVRSHIRRRIADEVRLAPITAEVVGRPAVNGPGCLCVRVHRVARDRADRLLGGRRLARIHDRIDSRARDRRLAARHSVRLGIGAELALVPEGDMLLPAIAVCLRDGEHHR